MKDRLRRIFFVLAVMLIGGLGGKINVYAEEVENECMEASGLLELQIQEVVQKILVDDTNNLQSVESEYIFVSEDAPDDIMSILKQRSTPEGYTKQGYGDSYTYQRKVLGVNKDIITITVAGEIYVYEDGKIHLHIMYVHAQSHVIGEPIIAGPEITNTDGSYGFGEAVVTLNTLFYGDFRFGCLVFVFGGDEDSEPSIWVDIDKMS